MPFPVPVARPSFGAVFGCDFLDGDFADVRSCFFAGREDRPSFGAVFGCDFLDGDFEDVRSCFFGGREDRPSFSFFAEVFGGFFDAAELGAGFSAGAGADAPTGFGRLPT
jgi:hypothetical protein